MNKILAIAAALALPTPVVAQDVSEGLEAFLCTFDQPDQDPVLVAVTLLHSAEGGYSVIGPWPDAEVTREGSRFMLQKGLSILQVQDGPSLMIGGGVVAEGSCRDVSLFTREVVRQAFEAAVEANPDAMTERAQEEIEQVESEWAAQVAALEAELAVAQDAARQAETLAREDRTARDEAQALNATLSRQLEKCRAILAESLSLMPWLSTANPSEGAAQMASIRRRASSDCPT